MIALAISGAGGRMGQRLLALSDADPEFTLVQAIEWSGFPLMGQSLNAGMPLAPRAEGVVWTAALAAGAKVLVDFSAPESAVENATLAAKFGTALVVGTTGLAKEQVAALRAASETVPVMFSANYSPGVNAMLKLVAEAARILGEGYDVEIVEAHHNRKVDAPSGTALELARAVAGERGLDPEADLRHGRSGRPGKRGEREIGMHALRMGLVTGDHTVYFCNDFECLSVTHHAQTRDVLAAGALRAAKWLCGRPAGFYTMQDMLNA